MTLETSVHDLFRQLEIWFEPVPVRCAFPCDMDHTATDFFAIFLVQDKPTTYIFRKSKEYLLRCTCREPFYIVHIINIVHFLQPLKMANK